MGVRIRREWRELFSPALPRMSITSPRGFLASSGHSVIFTTALSPSAPPLSLFLGMKMSKPRNLESVLRNVTVLSTWRVPMNDCSFRSMISTTSASASFPGRLAATFTRTRSPLRACMELRSATKIVSLSWSVITEFLPLWRRTKVPTATFVRCGDLNAPGATSMISPSNAISASMSATCFWRAVPEAPMA